MGTRHMGLSLSPQRSTLWWRLIAFAYALFWFSISPVHAIPSHSLHRYSYLRSRELHTRSSPSTNADAENSACENPTIPLYFDYSAKKRSEPHADTQLCPKSVPLSTRDVVDDYSCSETKPCSNGACCSKASGYCGYGPDSCGTNGLSPNDKCWSNCDAHAECGEFSLPAGKKCPLNVCCSEFGFCGMTAEFCAKDGDKGCQSNCEQPGSGSSSGDVQKRIIGYYEAWAHDRSCSGMTFQDIPVESLTHLNFAFGYIAPGSLEVVPMDDLPSSLFSDLTALKSRNRGLKAIISLGGWTFNDNGTSTQPVYSSMVSSADSRKTFIANLFTFMNHYGFDGVDFDWEYPGAPDRGGHPDDGVNFTTFLKELKEAIAGQSTKYEVSFTAPTSYWYLRWFDIEETMKNVDFANIMSYDLHGTWDSTNPIGNRVLAHTNLTEIKEALDLFWRNNVEPEKINLGMGFYGRSFQLSDPGCWQPGCAFKGGATAGACTQNSGTLSYKEITQIIDQENLTPYYDEENAVKYITWNKDQWVSYDDKETFQQKIKFANDLGLGGMLIWAIDLDTDDLQALRALLYPKELNAFNSEADKTSYWEDAVAGDCRATDCGGSCNPGEIAITKQPCGGAKPVTRHSKEADSTLCCPISAAPDPKNCKWEGTAPSCNGHCHPGQVALESNRWGDGKYCEDGLKFYCCDIPAAKSIDCSWKDTCDSSETLMTFDGTFLETIADIVDIFGGLFGPPLAAALDEYDREIGREFCCSAEEAKKWTNCKWHGQPGSCFDNHCDTGHQVQLAESAYGQGESCFPRMERTRAFCCDPADGHSSFLPVPLEYLFPNPPPKDTADTDVKLKVDPTWGTGTDKGTDDPNNAAFSFVVLASPEELQQTLDKRDGSHWELFDCNDSTSEKEQTIRMVCTDLSPASNCDKIHLGHGVPGTILEMPEGCGPGRYAVAKEMVVSKNQTLPHHLAKRSLDPAPVYDLTFDYEFTRVPRDLGDTQMRLDFSNEVGYWDSVVNKAGETKRKRSLAEHGGNHKRWLEDEWRDDMHFGGLSSREELHKRWFGSDIIEWLRNIVGVATGTQGLSHSIDEKLTAVLIDEQWGPCPVGGASVQANLNAKAQAEIKVDTNFGLTIITTLAFPPDLSNSYLYFRNKGEVTAKFTLDAIASVTFDTGPKELFGMDNFPGATFTVPGILTVGPNFKLLASVDASLVLAGHLESQVNIVSWEVQQTYPQQSSEYEPKGLDSPDRDGTQILGEPTFDYSVSARGEVTAHLMPTFTFGIDFEPRWKVDSCKVDLVADGWIRLMASAELSSNPATCPFTYGVDAGADLYAKLTVPSVFNWGSDQIFNIGQIPAKQIVQGGSCPKSQSSKRDLSRSAPWIGSSAYNYNNASEETGSLAARAINRRDIVVGPLISIPSSFLKCPGDTASDLNCPVCGSKGDVTGDLRRRDDTDGDAEVCRLPAARPENSLCTDDGSTSQKRDVYAKRWIDTGNALSGRDSGAHWLEKRAPKTDTKMFNWVSALGGPWEFSRYPVCVAVSPPAGVAKWYSFTDDTGCSSAVSKQNKNGANVGTTPIAGNFATDHVFEVQFITKFFKWLVGMQDSNQLPVRAGWQRATVDWVEGHVLGLPGAASQPFFINNQALNPTAEASCLDIIATHYVGSIDNQDPLALLLSGVNGAKGKWLAGDVNIAAAGNNLKQDMNNIRESAGVFSYLKLIDINDKFTAPSRSIELLFAEFDRTFPWGTTAGEPGRGPNGNGGLRNYWCYWIDAHMTQIERNIGLWRTRAQAAIQSRTGAGGAAEKYRDGEFATGASSAANMKFYKPFGNAPPADQSKFGMWGGQGLGAP